MKRIFVLCVGAVLMAMTGCGEGSAEVDTLKTVAQGLASNDSLLGAWTYADPRWKINITADGIGKVTASPYPECIGMALYKDITWVSCSSYCTSTQKCRYTGQRMAGSCSPNNYASATIDLSCNSFVENVTGYGSNTWTRGG